MVVDGTEYLVNKRNSYYIRNISGNYYQMGVYCGGTLYKAEPVGSISKGILTHIVMVVDVDNSKVIGYSDGVEEDFTTTNGSSIDSSAFDLIISAFSSSASLGSGQLPLFNMITDADAESIINKDLGKWVEKRWLKAKAKYGL